MSTSDGSWDVSAQATDESSDKSVRVDKVRQPALIGNARTMKDGFHSPATGPYAPPAPRTPPVAQSGISVRGPVKEL